MCVDGSSPLARGLRARGHRREHGPGIIPARAGFTIHGEPVDVRGQDHPRSRGVYHEIVEAHRSITGSSPLARGLPAGHTQDDAAAGIIPARAGFTGSRHSCHHDPRDHPRSRGVYGVTRAAGAPGRGSSPLARGLPAAVPQQDDAARIIPARAGFTGRSATTRRCWAGSSPLARGLLIVGSPRELDRRIIPARAGFT